MCSQELNILSQTLHQRSIKTNILPLDLTLSSLIYSGKHKAWVSIFLLEENTQTHSSERENWNSKGTTHKHTNIKVCLYIFLFIYIYHNEEFEREITVEILGVCLLQWVGKQVRRMESIFGIHFRGIWEVTELGNDSQISEKQRLSS